MISNYVFKFKSKCFSLMLVDATGLFGAKYTWMFDAGAMSADRLKRTGSRKQIQ